MQLHTEIRDKGAAIIGLPLWGWGEGLGGEDHHMQASMMLLNHGPGLEHGLKKACRYRRGEGVQLTTKFGKKSE